VGSSSGSLPLPLPLTLPLPLRGGAGVTILVALGPELVGNHHDGTSPLSLTPEGPVPAGWPIVNMFPHTGHLVRFPAWWSSALNLLPQEHDTEIIAMTSERNRPVSTGLTKRAWKRAAVRKPSTMKSITEARSLRNPPNLEEP
jgi:hypothetical protein